MFKIMLIGILLLSALLAAIPHLLWCLWWCLGRCLHLPAPYAPWGWSGVVLVLLMWGLLGYGYYIGRWQLETKEVEFRHRDVPAAFDGFRIVHISDLHLGTFKDNPQQLDRIVDTINALHPDLICFTGDLVSLGIEEAKPHVATLRRLKARHGVASVLGNHDFLIYRRDFATPREWTLAVERLADMQRRGLGWTLLRNESIQIREGGDSISIIGVDNCNRSHQGFRTIDRGNLPQAMAGTQGMRILLSHDPSHWMAEVVPETDIPLTLSGHTHAAQVRILGWTPAGMSFHETDGMYSEGNQWMYINIGLGCTAPVRIGATPEITLITLRRE